MSFEILEDDGSETVYAPLNTTIDADRDYNDLTGLDACACEGGITKVAQPGSNLDGFYPDGQLTPGMLGETEGLQENFGFAVFALGGFALWYFFLRPKPQQGW